MPERDSSKSFTRSESSIIWVLWLTYGAFYFCRTNISVAVPGMGSPVADGGLGLTGSEVGTILASLKLAYAFGQLINGQLSERFSPRRLLALGMFGSAILNVVFGFSTGFYFLLFVWACNGYAQSLGWTPCMRVAGNWVPVHRRGRAIGIIGTGYQITLGLTYFVAGQSAEFLGWRAAFYVPAAILAAGGLFMLFALKEHPDDEGHAGEHHAQPKGTFYENVLLTLTNPALWILGISLGLLNACRYGFLDWGVAHLVEIQDSGVGKASLKYIVLPLGAVAGSFLAGWATDRFFASRRAPVIFILLVSLGVLTLVYEYVSQVSVAGTMVLLGLIGFCIYGPQVLLVGTAPSDLARRGTPAAAAGFVNFVGYMGAATGDKVTGYYKMAEHGGWQVAIYIWAGWAFAAAIVAAFLWNVKGVNEELAPDEAVHKQQTSMGHRKRDEIPDGRGDDDKYKIEERLASQLGIPFVKLSEREIPERILGLVDENIAHLYRVIPIDEEGDTIILAMADPTNVHNLDNLSRLLDRPVEGHLATEEDIQAGLSRYYKL